MSESNIPVEDLQRYSDAFEKVSRIELSNIPLGYAYGRLAGELFDVGEGGGWRSFGATSTAVMLGMLTETLLVQKFARDDIDGVRQKYVPEIYRVQELMNREIGVSFFPHPLYLSQNPDEKDFLYYYMAATPQEKKSLRTLLGLERAENNSNTKTAHTLLHLALTGVYAAKIAVERGIGSALLEGIGAFLYGPSIALGIENAKDSKEG